VSKTRPAASNNTTGYYNTASGNSALQNNTTGAYNAALGAMAGNNALTGNYNLFLGAEVLGTASDTNTIRIGLPYDGTAGQNQTFIAGIYGTAVTAGVPVFINANGQLGIEQPGSGGGMPIPVSTTGAMDVTVAQLQQQVRDQQSTIADQGATIADQGARLARLEALVGASGGRNK
jgi:hypothetical protein